VAAAGLAATGYGGIHSASSAGDVVDRSAEAPLPDSFDTGDLVRSTVAGTGAAADGAPPRAAAVADPLPVPVQVAARYADGRPDRWGMDLPGIITVFPARGRQLALTFDACGGPGNDDLDETLLDYLVHEQIPATLFLNQRWIDADPARTERLAANALFEIGNHGSRHCPLSMTGRTAYHIPGTVGPQQVVDEVWGNHERIEQLLGRAPRFFRTGTAHYDDIAVAIVRDLGERPVGFTINADAGATFTKAEIERAMASAQPGMIAIAHIHRPRSTTAPGMIDALPKLRARGYEFVNLPGSS
jgi:peptidoglycan/xylan/chitin deacetylase (PgdA/CDA1 family)